ncbi:MAG: hypothetical protein Q9226_005222 [Calogaya cf. arnoldii]
MSHRGLCGPMYSQAIVDIMLQDPLTGQNLVDFDDEDEDERISDNYDRLDVDLMEERSDAYELLCNLVRDSLVRNMDQKCLENGSCKFPPENPFFRASYTKASKHIVGDKSVYGKGDVSNLYAFFTVKHHFAARKVLGPSYLESYRGDWDDAPNGWLHWSTWRVIPGYGPHQDANEMNRILMHIQYRLEQQFAADWYLEIIEVGPPFFQRCCEFDLRQICGHSHLLRRGHLEGFDSDEILGLVWEYSAMLFPTMVLDRAHRFFKGTEFLIIALAFANLPLYAIKAKLDNVVETLRVELEILKDVVMGDPKVVETQNRVLRAYAQDILLPEEIQPSMSTTLATTDRVEELRTGT